MPESRRRSPGLWSKLPRTRKVSMRNLWLRLVRCGSTNSRRCSRAGIPLRKMFPEDGNSESVLMKKADQAMYAAKREGKNLFRFCT